MKKLQTLKKDYADPLRNFARSKSTAIISKYEATTLFGNIDSLLPVNEAFLTDLEKMIAPNGYKAVGGVGDVALRHFKELKGFEQYRQYYVKREEAQRFIEQEMEKRSSPFEDYIEVSAVSTSVFSITSFLIASQISINGCKKSSWTSRAPHGTCSTNSAVYITLPTHDQAYASAGPSKGETRGGR